ncbi:hypothetical protein F4825DRAFT_424470 [Nemania diffusa]|nr:hypothetical protein F4825DRAFT_424470 [Nemania diffusa]
MPLPRPAQPSPSCEFRVPACLAATPPYLSRLIHANRRHIVLCQPTLCVGPRVGSTRWCEERGQGLDIPIRQPRSAQGSVVRFRDNPHRRQDNPLPLGRTCLLSSARHRLLRKGTERIISLSSIAPLSYASCFANCLFLLLRFFLPFKKRNS